MNDAEFDRALGEWEDNQLNAHLAGEDRWLNASDEAEEAIWDLKLNDLYEMAPEGVDKKIEALVDEMIEPVVQLMIGGGWG